MSTICPVCRAISTKEFLRREQVPVHQNLLCVSPDEARGVVRATLAMHACDDCGFVFNATFDSSKLAYGPQYDNTQDCSPMFSRYIDTLVRHLVEECGLRGKRIVEVGCGKGEFLRRLVSYPDAGNVGFGFDPSYTGPPTDFGGRLFFERRFYGPGCIGIEADAIVCRHVIEHVPDPIALLCSVRAALGREGRARVFFETPCALWILRNQVIWDFFYEHCSLFTAASLATAFEMAGFRVESTRHVFGGQYLWLEAVPGEPLIDPRRDAGEVPILARRYASAERRLIDAWTEKLAMLRHAGAVAVWGAGAKGATFVNLMDPAATLINCIVDLNPAKQGRFLSGTGHAIVDYRVLVLRGVTEVILMNPNYRDEILALLRQAGMAVNLIEWE